MLQTSQTLKTWVEGSSTLQQLQQAMVLWCPPLSFEVAS
jgi:hypothetical protein